VKNESNQIFGYSMSSARPTVTPTQRDTPRHSSLIRAVFVFQLSVF